MTEPTGVVPLGAEPPRTEIEFRYFTASWCGPCTQMAHIVDEMVAEVRRKVTGPDGSSADVDVTSRHIDVDAEPDVADAAAADRLPLLTLHVNTNEVLRLVGARPKRELREQVSAVLHKWWQD